jgi:hypothetical protein
MKLAGIIQAAGFIHEQYAKPTLVMTYGDFPTVLSVTGG